jgi:hypothetical protein
MIFGSISISSGGAELPRQLTSTGGRLEFKSQKTRKTKYFLQKGHTGKIAKHCVQTGQRNP